MHSPRGLSGTNYWSRCLDFSWTAELKGLNSGPLKWSCSSVKNMDVRGHELTRAHCLHTHSLPGWAGFEKILFIYLILFKNSCKIYLGATPTSAQGWHLALCLDITQQCSGDQMYYQEFQTRDRYMQVKHLISYTISPAPGWGILNHEKNSDPYVL